MFISEIKYRSKMLFEVYDKNLFKIFFIIALITAVVSYIGELISSFTGQSLSLIITIVITLAALPLTHGYITASMKLVNNNTDISIEEDSLAGVKRYTELFYTYFLKELFVFIICFIAAIIGMIIAFILITRQNLAIDNLINVVNNMMSLDESQLTSYIEQNYDVFTVLGTLFMDFMPMIIIICVADIYASISVSMVPYSLEKHHIYGKENIKYSMNLIKGYKWSFFKLQISYLGWIILSAIIDVIIMDFCPIEFLATLLSSCVMIYLYHVKLSLSETIFFEQLEYEANQEENYEFETEQGE